LAAATFWLALGAYLLSGPTWLGHPWQPWKELSSLPILKEILPDQFVPLLTLFLAFLIAVGLDALHGAHRRSGSWQASHRVLLTSVATAAVAAVALVPVFMTFDAPLRVVPVRTPAYLRQATPIRPPSPVLLTIPFAVSGSSAPMLWQATEGMRFRLAGAALKTPDALGGPVGSGPPGSARRILTNLTLSGTRLPTGTTAQLATVRAALSTWRVDEVVVTGASRDPVYASGFFTMTLGVAPAFVRGAWVWRLAPGGATTPAATGSSLSVCRGFAAERGQRSAPLAMAQCVLFGAGRA
jgi:hypothetical protein